MAGFGVDAACVRHADRQIHVAHDLGEEDVWHVVDFQLLTRLAVEKRHPFQRRRFDVRWGEPVRHRPDGRDDVLFVVDLLQAGFHVRHPAAGFQARQRPRGLNLVARIAQGLGVPQFIRRFDVQFAENLPNGLHNLVAIQLLLPRHPLLALIEVVRVRENHLRRAVQCGGFAR